MPAARVSGRGRGAPQRPTDRRKLAAQTARRIETEIIEAGWEVGSALGSADELVARYDVSPAVVREAIRLVEHRGAAIMRRGATGGLIVRAPDAAAAVAAAVVYLEHSKVSVGDILYARRILEPLAASLAATHIDEDGIDQLRRDLDRDFSSDPSEILAPQDAAVHLTVAKLSRNEPLQLFIEILARLTTYYASSSRCDDQADASRRSQEVQAAHRAIASAVIAGDSSSAQHRVETHIEAIATYLAPGGRTPGTMGLIQRGGTPKLAEVVAQRIRTEIATSGKSIGTVWGSERSLLQRYGVSRAVLREAVRILEHHSIATMRRGPAGGLVITQPDPVATAEAVALYLEYRHAVPEDLQVVRDALELGVIDLLADRISESAISDGLAAALRVDEAMALPDLVEPANHLHTQMAELTGNPVVGLLVQIVLALWSRHLDYAEQIPPQSSPEISAAVTHSHTGIVEALTSGDRSLARHRMRRHLAALTGWWDRAQTVIGPDSEATVAPHRP